MAPVGLAQVFGSDLVAAHRDGLLVLGELDALFEATGTVLGPMKGPRSGLIEGLESARQFTSRYVAIHGPEHVLAIRDWAPEVVAGAYARELVAAHRAYGLNVTVNLNMAAPPAWAHDLGGGPLFAPLRQEIDDRQRSAIAACLLDAIAAIGEPGLRLAWHVSEDALRSDDGALLRKLVGLATRGASVCLVVDRSRRSPWLAEGLTSDDTTVLMSVGVNLSHLAERGAGDATQFLQRVGSLARLARAAGHAKLEYLRRHGRASLREAFRLERSRIVVFPMGLADVISKFAETSGPGFAGQVLQKLGDALVREPPHHLGACLSLAPPPPTWAVASMEPANKSIDGTGRPLDRTGAEAGLNSMSMVRIGATVMVPAAATTIGASLKTLMRDTEIQCIRLIPPAG
jgi:hypothetical protein